MSYTIAKAYSHTFVAEEIEESDRTGLDEHAVRVGGDLLERPPLTMDTGAYYFPLDDDARGYLPSDSVKTIEPAIVTNIAFDDEGGWVGQAATNLWPLKTGNCGWTGTTVSNSKISIVGDLRQELYKDGTVTRVHSTLGASNSLSIVSGANYTISAYYRDVDGNSISPSQFKLVKSTGGTAIAMTDIRSVIPAIKEQWQRGIRSATYSEAVTAWPYIDWSALPSMTSRFCGMMLEAKPFASAWCYDTRGAGVLAFNLHESCGLNWNEDYTIMYWKRPHGTHDGTASTGHSIDSIGRNSNTVGGGYRYWGKLSGDTLYGFPGTMKTIDDYTKYQYGWHLHVLRRSGTTLTLRVYGIGVDGLFLSQDVDDSTAVNDDRYVTQNGYDLQLGGWDAGNPCNTYYRDLVVLPGVAMTNDELDKLYRRKLQLRTTGYESSINNLVEGLI